MRNFEFLSPTKLIFGKDAELQTGVEVKKYSSKILLHYGGGSIKKSGLYDRITQSLKKEGIEYIELSGVQPNPRLSMVKEGIKICRENKIGFILAVGGGSVIDSSKAMSIGIPYQGDVWDFYAGKALPEKSIPIGAVVTIAAAGSETSMSSVITNEDGWLKRGLNHDITRARFAVLNPALTATLPPFQTACGAVDIMAHVMERYFTVEKNVDYTDRLCEATLRTVIENAPIAIKDPSDYNARAEIMFAGAIAHNDFLSAGRLGDWGSHLIEHEISGIYDVAHGAGLSVVFPAWMKYTYKKDISRFAQFAVRVWNCEYNFSNPELTAFEGIKRTEEFYKDLGMPVTLEGLGIKDDRLAEMADKCRRSPEGMTGNCFKMTRDDVLNVLKLTRK